MNLIFALSCMMAVMWLICGKCETAPELVSNIHRRMRNGPLLWGYSLENRVVKDNGPLDPKNQQRFDDYGHMRFGKREQFDDYGHMRFGRGHE